MKRNIYKIAVLVIIGCILFFSKSVLSNALDFKEQSFYEATEAEQAECNASADEQSEPEKAVVCKSEDVINPVSKSSENNHSFSNEKHARVFLYHIVVCVYICAVSLIGIVLCAILIKDNSNLRYEKLDKLLKLYEEISKETENKQKENELTKHCMSCLMDI